MTFKTGARNIALTALMAALLVAGKFALSFIPNVEVVTIFILTFSCAFGLWRTLPAVLIFCLLDMFLYPTTIDVIMQYFFHWPLLCVTASLAGRASKSEFLFLGIAAAASVLFWAETSAIYWMLRLSVFLPSLIAGIPFFVVNLVSNCAIVLVLFRPLERVLSRAANRLL